MFVLENESNSRFHFAKVQSPVVNRSIQLTVQQGGFNRFSIDLYDWFLGGFQVGKSLIVGQSLPGGEAKAGGLGEGIFGLDVGAHPTGSFLFLFLVRMRDQ